MGFGDQASSRRVRPDPRSEKAGTNPLCPWFQFQIRDTVALHAMSSEVLEAVLELGRAG